MPLVHLEQDTIHAHRKGCVIERSCIPQRHWCQPMPHVADLLFHLDVYVTGGVSMKARDIGFSRVMQASQPVGLSPYLEHLVTTEQHLCFGLTVDLTDACVLKIVLCDANGELANGTLIDKEFWLRIYGTR